MKTKAYSGDIGRDSEDCGIERFPLDDGKGGYCLLKACTNKCIVSTV